MGNLLSSPGTRNASSASCEACALPEKVRVRSPSLAVRTIVLTGRITSGGGAASREQPAARPITDKATSKSRPSLLLLQFMAFMVVLAITRKVLKTGSTLRDHRTQQRRDGAPSY